MTTDPMRLDPEHKAAAEDLFTRQMRDHQEPDGSYSCDPHVMLDYAVLALGDAGFVVLHRDDVIEERGVITPGDDYVWDESERDPGDVNVSRLVTRWEPITNEDVGPWTTKETP